MASNHVSRSKDARCLVARLVFVRCRPHSIILDCVAVTDDGWGGQSLTAGWPFALELRNPDTPWFSLAIQSMLRGWADENRLVEVELDRRPDRRRSRLRSRDAQVVLELETAVGMG